MPAERNGDHLKIVELTAENVKRIKAVNIKPNGHLVEIGGRNGQGKSSVLDAIWWAFAGAAHIQSVPIRNGENEAQIKLDLGAIKVRRRFSRAADGGVKTDVIVETEDGARFPSPQAMLEKLFGALSFDPLAFERMDPKKQFDALKRFVPDFDFAADQAAYDTDFKARTEASRKAKDLRAQVAGVGLVADAPEQRVDDAGLIADLEKAGEHNLIIERRRARREQAAADIVRQDEIAATYRENAKQLRAQADEEDRKAADHEASAADLRKAFEQFQPLPEAIDTADVRRRIAEAQASNEKFDAAARAVAERDRLAAAAAVAEARVEELTAALTKRQAGKRAAIAAAEMPVDGLSFGTDEILLNGVPFEQASSAERLRTSIAIAMASNPRLRVIRVSDGSLLDADAMQLLAEMAADRDYQVWIERVGGDGKMAFIIEDGAIKVDEPALEAAE